MAVLDNFHFDLSLSQSLHRDDEITDNKQQASSQQLHKEGDISPKIDAKREAENHAGLESEESQEELEMEEEEESECVQEEKENSVGEEGDLTKQRAMVQKIHKAIVNSILPSLEGVLTKRVSKISFITIEPNCTHVNIHLHALYIRYKIKIDVPGHKLSRLSHESESNSEQLRVPVAMAITKLLLTLPEETLHTRLPR